MFLVMIVYLDVLNYFDFGWTIFRWVLFNRLYILILDVVLELALERRSCRYRFGLDALELLLVLIVRFLVLQELLELREVGAG